MIVRETHEQWVTGMVGFISIPVMIVRETHDQWVTGMVGFFSIPEQAFVAKGIKQPLYEHQRISA